jgi:putative intracellular protease/amidase
MFNRQQAPELFATKDAVSKREFLGFVLSKAVWADGSLTVEFNQPFDILADATAKVQAAGDEKFDEGALFSKWYPRPGSNRRPAV